MKSLFSHGERGDKDTVRFSTVSDSLSLLFFFFFPSPDRGKLESASLFSFLIDRHQGMKTFFSLFFLVFVFFPSSFP